VVICQVLRFKQAIVVEGKYDKANLAKIVESMIVSTDGFDVYKNASKREMIKKLAETSGIIILTDSDSAGMRIRNYIKNFCGVNASIQNVYIPEILGKERRKEHASKEGKLGVEGIEEEVLKKILERLNVRHCEEVLRKPTWQSSDLYALGLIGQANSKQKRQELCKKHNLPKHLSTKQLIEILNALNIEI